MITVNLSETLILNTTFSREKQITDYLMIRDEKMQKKCEIKDWSFKYNEQYSDLDPIKVDVAKKLRHYAVVFEPLTYRIANCYFSSKNHVKRFLTWCSEICLKKQVELSIKIFAQAISANLSNSFSKQLYSRLQKLFWKIRFKLFDFRMFEIFTETVKYWSGQCRIDIQPPIGLFGLERQTRLPARLFVRTEYMICFYAKTILHKWLLDMFNYICDESLLALNHLH